LAVLSKSRIKLIRSLEHKKYRDQNGLFVVEGEKMVLELLNTLGPAAPDVAEVIATGEWIRRHEGFARSPGLPVQVASEQEIRSISSLMNPQPVLALVRIPKRTYDPEALSARTILALESIRDPGNLGTIIRTADWFGIGNILCSPDSVDLYNPKVVQSTMGSLLRVQVHYTEFESFLKTDVMKAKPVLGTFPEGESIYSADLGDEPLILFGNESRGLSPALEPFLQKRISIPSFAAGPGSESLNLAASVAVVCSELRRRTTRSGNSA
jgi:TrmH family RNA methyltransferase